MMYEKAVVAQRYNQQLIWVESQVKTTCGTCQHNKNCGTGVLASMMAKKTNRVLVECVEHVEVGQEVTVAIPEHNLLAASWLLYGLPLISFMLTLMVAQLFNWHELLVLLASSTVMAIAFSSVKGLQKRFKSTQILPHVVQSVGGIQYQCSDN
ncbi:Sigma factor RpoE regulatory protein RseC [Catenovulum agarivorans DS-2]|uniref:Sigma factor RpoE regulatory protein RseC n=1 Tax=Catenovulum agarivorans DS-2 TaxID=1328313 RepID=W7QGE4_9ALTE|nr:SoxR reducing system RseC family protein [Catenovulum agarivorans]EWH12004.1 Sigma factor RpoE regulatory protein RseC [Catenovulum agarivorans DS-2]